MQAMWKGATLAESDATVVVVDGQRNTDPAWFYPDPESASANIKGRMAFWRGVEVTS